MKDSRSCHKCPPEQMTEIWKLLKKLLVVHPETWTRREKREKIAKKIATNQTYYHKCFSLVIVC